MSFLQDGKEWDAPVLAAKFCLLGAKCLLQTENRQNGLIAFWLQSIAFWLQSVFFKQKMDRMDLQKLFEVREMANSLYSLALENNLGDKVKNLLENLGNGGHGIALQKLKDKFGIIRESLKGTSVRCTHGSNAYALSYGSF